MLVESDSIIRAEVKTSAIKKCLNFTSLKGAINMHDKVLHISILAGL